MVNCRKKGQRNEIRAEKKLLQEGYLVYRVKGSTKFNLNVDIFNLFDILAIKLSPIPPFKQYRRWIQVKTNKKLYGKGLKEFENFGKNYCDSYDSVEIHIWWNRGKNKKIHGWEIVRI